MQIDYNIRELGIHKNYKGIENVVYEIRMDVEGSNGLGSTAKFFHVMHLNLDNLNKDTFIQLDDLEKGDVVKIIESNLDEGTRSEFIERFEEMFDPPTYYIIPEFKS